MQWFNTFLSTHQSLIGLIIFLIAFLECFAFVGLLIPGLMLLFAASVMAGKASFPLWAALLLCFLAGWLGDLVSYGLGRQFKSTVYRLSVIKRNPQWISKAEAYFKRYGGMSLLLGRFISPLRPVLPIMAGLFNLSFIQCVSVSFVASVVWSVVFVAPGWAVGAAFSLPVGEMFWVELGCVLVILGLVVGVGLFGCLIKQSHWVSSYMAIMCALLFGTLYAVLPYLSSLDHGLLLVAQIARSPQLDKWATFVTELGDYKQQFVISGALCFLLLYMKQIKALVFFVGTMAGTATIGWIIKELVARERPQVLLEPLHTFSFPSGHTSASFAFCLSLGVLAGLGRSPRSRVLWLFIAGFPAVLIGLSRIYLGVHWTTDVVAGGLLASAICMGCLSWVQRRSPIAPLPSRCWKILLVFGLVVLGVTVVYSLPHAFVRYEIKS